MSNRRASGCLSVAEWWLMLYWCCPLIYRGPFARVRHRLHRGADVEDENDTVPARRISIEGLNILDVPTSTQRAFVLNEQVDDRLVAKASQDREPTVAGRVESQARPPARLVRSPSVLGRSSPAYDLASETAYVHEYDGTESVGIVLPRSADIHPVMMQEVGHLSERYDFIFTEMLSRHET